MDSGDPPGSQSPGAMLRRAREGLDMSPREVADRLHWLPSYVGIIERDDYAALRCPALARGYVRAYGKLLEVDEGLLMTAFGAFADTPAPAPPRVHPASRPPAPGGVNGLAIGFGLLVLGLLVLGLWWWQGGGQPAAVEAAMVQPPISTTGEL